MIIQYFFLFSFKKLTYRFNRSFHVKVKQFTLWANILVTGFQRCLSISKIHFFFLAEVIQCKEIVTTISTCELIVFYLWPNTCVSQFWYIFEHYQHIFNELFVLWEKISLHEQSSYMFWDWNWITCNKKIFCKNFSSL